MPPYATRGLSRRNILALATTAFPAFGFAQAWPARPIRFIGSSAPGGGVDLTARLVAPRIADELKGTIVVEAKPGASGIIAGDYVAKAAPDGYTLMFAGGSALTIVPQLMAKMSFDPLNDLVPVNYIGGSPLVVNMHPGLGIRTLNDFVTQARARTLKLASAGTGTLTHLTIELLSQATGGKIIHVPYKGGGPALTDALAGHVDGMVSDIPPILQHVNDGRLLAVAVTSEQRVSLLPGVPTVNEVLPGVSAVAWQGVFAPAKTPRSVVDKLSAAIVKGTAGDDIRAQLRQNGMEPGSFATPEEFRKFVAAEYERWGKFIKARNITMPT